MSLETAPDNPRPQAVRPSPREWRPRGRDLAVHQHQAALLAIFEAVAQAAEWDEDALPRILAQHPRPGKGPSADAERGYFSKIELVAAYRQLTQEGVLPFQRHVMRRLQMKPMRTASGVAPVTVLTEPAGCPGQCIFCPDAVGMPKSYLPDEPGARRAAQCGFDPYLQVRTRLATLSAMGHAADKVELLILGGTWSAYSKQYREWFVRRCLEALNEPAVSGAESEPCSQAVSPPGVARATDLSNETLLDEAQARNETAPQRSVGLVIETRPDWVTPAEVVHLRRLGVTKVQLGVQSLDDRVLALNRRGHTVADSRRAVRLLRIAGFKVHLHWMPNLLGSTPASDQVDFSRLWSDPALRPDELKIYPCSIIADTPLYRLWQAGAYQPYTDDELVALISECKATIPPYCRVNRIFRDIPADDIVAGSKKSNLRQIVQRAMAVRGLRCHCIRCREIRHQLLSSEPLQLVTHSYATDVTHEQFLSFETAEGWLAGFLRLSLPVPPPQGGDAEQAMTDVQEIWRLIPEIAGAAMIREVHIYGPALSIGTSSAGEAQHLGLGRRLIAAAADRARAAGFGRLAVISAIGTRRYYEESGFERGNLYMVTRL